jgi:voltage-gated potassium channel
MSVIIDSFNLERFRHRLHEIFHDQKPDDHLRKMIEWLILGLILVSVVSIILESEAYLHDLYEYHFRLLEIITIGIFTLEYLLRLWSAPSPINLHASHLRWQYVFSFHGIVDFMATAPFYLSLFLPIFDLRFLRILRLVRVLKLSHFNTALEDVFSAIREERKSFFSAFYLLFIALIISSSLMYFVEGHQNHFDSIMDTLWWSVITVTSVGYGDVYPVTGIGKVIGSITAILGICTTALLTGIVANSFVNQMARKRAIYESELLKALRDGTITPDESMKLEKLRIQFNITKEHADAIKEKALEEMQH